MSMIQKLLNNRLLWKVKEQLTVATLPTTSADSVACSELVGVLRARSEAEELLDEANAEESDHEQARCHRYAGRVLRDLVRQIESTPTDRTQAQSPAQPS